MFDETGTPAHVVIIGGTSEIGEAIASRYVQAGTPRVTLLARSLEAAGLVAVRLRERGAEVELVSFDAHSTSDHHDALAQVTGDIDLAVVAMGVLGDQEAAWREHSAAVELATVNYVGAVSVGVLLAERMSAQGHGVIVALSSVAGERVRRANFVYGSSKAGMDGFYLGLGEALLGSGARVLVVRPGFVRSAMTRGLDVPPLACDPEQVAEAVVQGVEEGSELIWVPRTLRGVMFALRQVPRPLFRRLPL
jgi:decaprenylphospho-beta-D-erythro-pentofuranosid-2-ulose 2-reductase